MKEIGTPPTFRHTAIRIRPDWRQSAEAEKRETCKHKKLRLHDIFGSKTLFHSVRCVKCGTWWDVTENWAENNTGRLVK